MKPPAAFPDSSSTRPTARWRCMMKTAACFLVAGVAASGGAAEAAVVVSFHSGGYALTRYAHMSGYTSDTSSVPYSDTSYLSPPDGSNYNRSLPGALFYGGAATDGADGLTTYRVVEASGTWTVDRIYATSSSVDATVTQVVVWKQEDFLELTTGEVAFDSTTKVSLTLATGGSGRTATARLVIQRSGDYYISEVIGTASGTPLSSIANVDPTQLDWFQYDPANLAVIGTQATLPDLAGLTAVGIWAKGTGTGTAAPGVAFGGLTVEAVAVVPEPGAVVLTGLGLLGLVAIRRYSGA
ncbi:MAG TPA: hypothetical protein VNQ90_04900 [Chthoniobacteraceae bacterium]|nr:hypothetical protein [Chthoniobacteraceae bacterium]